MGKYEIGQSVTVRKSLSSFDTMDIVDKIPYEEDYGYVFKVPLKIDYNTYIGHHQFKITSVTSYGNFVPNTTFRPATDKDILCLVSTQKHN